MSGRILSEWINRLIKFFPVLPVHWPCWCCCPHTFTGPSPHRWSLQAKGKRHSSLYILFLFFSPQQKGHYSLQVELGRWNVQFLGSSCPFSPPLFHPKATKFSRPGQECPSLRATSRWCHQLTVAPHLPPAPHWPTPCTWLWNDKKRKLFIKKKGRFFQSLPDASGFQS